MTVTLLNGPEGWAVAILALATIARMAFTAWEWLASRLTLTRRGLSVRWDRPGAWVLIPGGRTAKILYRIDDDDAGDMAIVQPQGAEWEEPCWVPAADLSPAARPERGPTLRGGRP